MIEQKEIWNTSWEENLEVNPESILNSRFTKDAYSCFKRFINEGDNMSILESGCGTGRFCALIAKDFPNSKVSGIDLSHNALKIANRIKAYLKLENVNFYNIDIFRTPYPDNHFDIVFNEGVIEHYSLDCTPSYIDAIREMIRITKVGGKIIVAVPNWYNFIHTFYKWFLKTLDKNYVYGYEKSFKYIELVSLFSKFGLKEIEACGFLPSYGFYRLSGGGLKKVFYYLGKTCDFIMNLKILKKEIFKRRFGFEIVIKGRKI